MNLDTFFEEGGVNNLDWLCDTSKNFKPQFKPDMKEDLIRQWNSQFDPTFTVDYERVDAEVNEDEGVVLATKEMINAGMVPKQIVSHLRKSFAKNDILSSKNKIAKLLTEDAGAIGCFVAVVDHTKNTKQALKVSSKNKRHIGYVRLESNCGDDCIKCCSIYTKSSSLRGDGIDGFFQTGSIQNKFSHKQCQITNLPILSGQDDISEEFMDSTLIDLVNSNRITKDDVAEIKSMNTTSYKKLQKAFIVEYDNILNANREKHANIESNEKFKIDASEMKVSVNETTVKAVEVKTKSNLKDEAVEIDAENKVSTFNMNKLDVADVKADVCEKADNSPLEATDLVSKVEAQTGAAEKSIEVEEVINFVDQDDLQIEKELKAKSKLNVDGSKADLELGVGNKKEEIDVEASCFVEREFEGCDMIEVLEAKQKISEITIDDVGEEFIID